MKIRKIAIIGSNSFFGSHFVDRVLTDTNWKILCISRSKEYKNIFLPYLYKKKRSGRLSFFKLDVNRDFKKMAALLDREKPDVVVNFAAQGFVPASWDYPEDYFTTNCMGVVKLANHLSKKSYLKKYIQISTPEIYGSFNNLKETSTYFNPTTPYGASRGAADLFLMAMFQTKKFPVCFVRAANVYGPHQQTYRIVPMTIISLKGGKKINLWGSDVKRNFIHVTDASRGILQTILKGRNGSVYHFTAGKNISINGLVKNICIQMGVSFNKMVKDTPAVSFRRDKVYQLNSKKTEKELGWKPKVLISSGIKEVIKWVDECWQDLKNAPLEYTYKK